MNTENVKMNGFSLPIVYKKNQRQIESWYLFSTT